MREKDVFSGAFLYQPALATRLVESFREAKREFAENPRQYMTLTVKGEGLGGALRVDRLRFGLALSLALYVILMGVSFLLWSLNKPDSPDLAVIIPIHWLTGPGRPAPLPESPVTGQNPGGGGGGRPAELRPATGGDLPRFSNEKPFIAPTTRIQLEPPSLPMPETLQIDPRLQPVRQEIAPTGLPFGPPGPSSDGPGSGSEGIGTSKGGGVGPGEGPGYGSGKNGIGGGPGGSGGRPRTASSGQLTSKPIALNRPRPNYTEEARLQRVQGVIKASVLVGSDGIVKLVRLQNGLPAGLDEEAIRAAYEMRFHPGVTNGHPIETWVTLEIEFNLR